MRLYSREDFKYDIIEEVCNSEDLDDKERFWIGFYIDKGYSLYNRELGGKKGTIVSECTKILQSRVRNIREFYAIDIHTSKIVGEFNTIKEAKNKLNTTQIGRVLSGDALYTKDYTFIFKDEYCDDYAKQRIDEIIKYKEKTKRKTKGNKNAMYGMSEGKNPNSKKIFIVKDGVIIEIFECLKNAKEKYGWQIGEYSRGYKNHYYKKYNFRVYNKNNLPVCIREIGKEVSYS